ncbi:MAG: phosphohydrolase [Desulfatitalea sp.]|nr:phosphohydrolase [Desulfatitalea sp.]
MTIDPLAIIYQFYRSGAPGTELLLAHSRQVRDKALAVAGQVTSGTPDMVFIAEAAMLHDIGICGIAAPSLECHGKKPYVCHGAIGRRMLDALDLPRHGLVCERHVGTGITPADIRRQRLPLPERDMTPQTLEEQIICYADKFFSKSKGMGELPLSHILSELGRYGQDKVRIFLKWHNRFTVQSRTKICKALTNFRTWPST